MKEQNKGALFAIASYISWGLLPIYWKLMQNVSSLEILAHRIIWSAVFTFIFCIIWKRHYLKKYFSNRRDLLRLSITGILVSANWGIYIYAVNANHILDASLGYYINPIVSVLLGIIFLKERLNKTQIIAFLITIAGVAYFTIDYGKFPWVAISLATTFGVYGLLKKKMNFDSMTALSIETMLALPLALIYMGYLVSSNSNVFMSGSSNISTQLLLISTGVITVLPLYWFGLATVRVPLYSIGFFQYIAPTLKLLIGIFIFDEAFTISHVICFSAIWLALILYIRDIIKNN